MRKFVVSELACIHLLLKAEETYSFPKLATGVGRVYYQLHSCDSRVGKGYVTTLDTSPDCCRKCTNLGCDEGPPRPLTRAREAI